MSRFIAGGPAWNLGESAPYMPAYSLVIAPADVLGFSPTGVYRWAILSNVVLAGLTYLVIEVLTRRLTMVRRPWSAVVALVATSLPALVMTASLAWSDNLAPLLFGLIALGGLRLLEEPTARRAMLLGVVAVAGYAGHARFLPLVLVVAGLLVAVAVGGRLAWATVSYVVVGSASAVVAVNVAAAHLARDLNMVGREAGELGRVFAVDALLTSVLGQLWYLIVTTGGLAILGGVVLVRSASGPTRQSAVFLLALVGVAFATSAGYMTDRPRPDHLVYGRYNDMFVAILVVVGLGSLATEPLRRLLTTMAAAGAAAIVGAALVWFGHLETLRQSFVPYSVLGVVAFDPLATQRFRSVTVGGLAVVLVVGVLAVLARSWGRPMAAVCGCGVLVLGALIRAEGAVDRFTRADPATSRVLADIVGPGQPIVCASTVGCPLLEFYRYQFYVPSNPFRLVWDETWRAEAVVLAGVDEDDVAVLTGLGYVERWRDAPGGSTLWVR